MPLIEDMKIKIENISKSYSQKEVLKNINLELNTGECVALIGGNGSGKSTLLSILSGSVKNDGGSFYYGEDNLFKDSKKRSQLVGYVPQFPPLIEELSALDNLKLWYKKDALEDDVIKMLGVDKFLKTRVSKMSGGMKKRLSIACAVAHHPKVLLLDEPSSSLDIVCKKEILSYLSYFQKEGGSVIIATHDTDEIRYSNKTYLIKNCNLSEYLFDGDIERLTESL